MDSSGSLAKRKQVQGILQFRNMQATKDLAEKAQKSAENMEAMTVEMHTIAQKTKVETVSMRIITLVTLFFLPGTFISVSQIQLLIFGYLTLSDAHEYTDREVRFDKFGILSQKYRNWRIRALFARQCAPGVLHFLCLVRSIVVGETTGRPRARTPAK